MITYERLVTVLDYDILTGVFRWRISGKIAGTTVNGYVKIYVDGKIYAAHRLAWLYVYGAWPEDTINHKDTVRHHNWIDNLEELSRSIHGQKDALRNGHKKIAP